MRLSDLRCKEIINICSGERLGFVYDVEADFPGNKLEALIVPGPCRFFGLFGREPDYVIPMDCISRVGEDIILVDIQGSYGRSKRGKKVYE